jgi:hypothetical protein
MGIRCGHCYSEENKFQNTQSVPKFGCRGISYISARIKVPERHSSLHPFEKELIERRSKHKNTPGCGTVDRQIEITLLLCIHVMYFVQGAHRNNIFRKCVNKQ